MKVFVYHEHALLTWASRKLKNDVRFNPERSEAFLSDVHGRDHVSYIEVGVDGLGVMQGLRVTTFANMGAYCSNFGPYIPTGSGGHMMPGCYAVPNCYVNVKGVITNTTPVDAYRGAGRPEVKPELNPPRYDVETSSRQTRCRTRPRWVTRTTAATSIR